MKRFFYILFFFSFKPFKKVFFFFTLFKMSPSIDSLKCIQCNCMESMLWKLVGDNQHLCIDCSDQSKTNGKIESESNRKPDEKRGKLRKSTRSTRYNGKIGSNGTSNSTATTTSNSTKSNNVKPSGRGRRNLFRRQPIKAPTIPATTRNVKSLFYKVYKIATIIYNYKIYILEWLNEIKFWIRIFFFF